VTRNVSFRFGAPLVLLCIGFGASGVSAGELRLDDEDSGAAPFAEARSHVPQSIAQATEASPATTSRLSPADKRAKRTCLVLENRVIIDGASERAYGMMCAGDDGVWRLVPF
jgi:hypothetical protein